MALQDAVTVTLASKVESSFGVPAGTSGAQFLRRVQSTLAAQKDSFQSNEARTDQQVITMRHGARRVAGGIEGELSLGSYDHFIEAVMRGTWTAGASKSNSDFTSVAADNAGSKFTVADSSWVAQGFKVGDVIRFVNLSEAANNNKNFRIIELDDDEAIVSPAPTDMSADTAFTVSVVGSKLINGTQKRSFTLEQSMPDIDISEQFFGCRITGMGLGVQPTGVATVSFDVMGKNAVILEGTDSPYFTTPTVETTTDGLTGLEGGLFIDGSEVAIVTGLDLQINLNPSAQPVIGSPLVPQIFYGRTVVTGNLSAFLENASLINAFLNESVTELMLSLETADDPAGFLALTMRRMKFTAANKTIGSEGGVIVQMPFQALLQVGGSGTDADQTTLQIQRSNS